ncbi:MAG TPA: hypothetical protein VFG11_10650 [Acidobacteriota bacterium]|nr:hypothetical protein [Acidobacteriota bacterium]
MRKVLLLALALGVLLGSKAFATDKFWVSLGAENEPPNPPILLMQIDELGNVTIPPFVAVSVASINRTTVNTDSERSTALSYDSSGNILLFYDLDDDGTVFRVTINKNTLVPSKPKKILKNLNDPNFLQVTQPSPSILAVGKVDTTPLGFRGDANGVLTGSSYRLNPRSGPSFSYTMSADGSMEASALDNNNSLRDHIYIQPQDANGPLGDPAVVIEHGQQVEDMDITNLLPNGKRFLVFEDDNTENYFLQVLNGVSGDRIGSPILLTSKLDGEVDQQIAIDPQGRFVLFNIADSEVGCTKSDPVFFQKLDPNSGSPMGIPKQITDCDIYTHFITLGSTDDEGIFGIDILKVQ